jgi:diguanylate cyclase (GGDEF)-like protein
MAEHTAVRRLVPWRYGIWSIAAPAMAYVVAVDVVALVALAAILSQGFRLENLGILLILIACAILSTEGARLVERRRRTSSPLHKDFQPVWLLAAAFLLPLAGAVLFTIAQRSWWRIRAGHCIPYRWFFSTCVAILSAASAHLLFHEISGALVQAGWPAGSAMVVGMLLGGVSYFLLDTILCAIAIKLMKPSSTLRDAFGGLEDWSVDGIALTLGCVVAAAAAFTPWFALLAVPASLIAQRALLLRQLEVDINTDRKTEMANFSWWREQAESLFSQLVARQGRLTVLFIDLDLFRSVNAQYGHLVGDRALLAVAQTLRGLVRREDLVGRFGGEEFVVALPHATVDEAYDAAERIRTEISRKALLVPTDDGDGSDVEVLVTVSIGMAAYPEDGVSIDRLLEQADRALYAAKAAGRNRVMRADPGSAPVTGTPLQAYLDSPLPR